MKIHLHSKPGLYSVVDYNNNTILVETKHSSFRTPVNDFKSIAGGNWNINVSKTTIDRFLETVQPSKIQELERQTIVLQKYIDENYMDENTDGPDELYDYEELYNNANKQLVSLQNKISSIARNVYSQNLNFDDYQNPEGIKFIIQYNSVEKSYRFRWDPYRFKDNYHSAISNLYSDPYWHTVNGGWIRVIDNNVILYAKSSDYGVYEDNIAIELAKEIFPNKEIHSYAGKQWDEELTDKFMPLPF